MGSANSSISSRLKENFVHEIIRRLEWKSYAAYASGFKTLRPPVTGSPCLWT